MASGNDTVSGEASLQSEYVSLVGQGDTMEPRRHLHRQKGMQNGDHEGHRLSIAGRVFWNSAQLIPWRTISLTCSCAARGVRPSAFCER